MSTGRPPPGSVPTLTEVLSWPAEAERTPEVQRNDEEAPQQARPRVTGPTPSLSPPAAANGASEAEIGERLLAQIQQQLELSIDVRLREALAPMLARTADSLVRDARREMAAVLRDMVSRAVDAELERRRKP